MACTTISNGGQRTRMSNLSILKEHEAQEQAGRSARVRRREDNTSSEWKATAGLCYINRAGQSYSQFLIVLDDSRLDRLRLDGEHASHARIQRVKDQHLIGGCHRTRRIDERLVDFSVRNEARQAIATIFTSLMDERDGHVVGPLLDEWTALAREHADFRQGGNEFGRQDEQRETLERCNRRTTWRCDDVPPISRHKCAVHTRRALVVVRKSSMLDTPTNSECHESTFDGR